MGISTNSEESETNSLFDYQVDIEDVGRSRMKSIRKHLKNLSDEGGNGVPIHDITQGKNGNERITGFSIHGTNLRKGDVESVVAGILNSKGKYSVRGGEQEAPQVVEPEDTTEKDWDAFKQKLAETKGEVNSLRNELEGSREELHAANVDLTEAKDEIAITSDLYNEEIDKCKGLRESLTDIGELLGVAAPEERIFNVPEKTEEYTGLIRQAIEDKRESTRAVEPDPATEFLDVHIAYIIGMSDTAYNKKAISDALTKHGVEKGRTLAGGGKVRIFSTLTDKIDDVLGEIGLKTKTELDYARHKIMSYFRGEKDEEWSPEFWGDDKKVDCHHLALSYSMTSGAVTCIIKKIEGAKPIESGRYGRQIYRWGDIKEFFENKIRKIKSPQSVKCAPKKKKKTDEDVLDWLEDLESRLSEKDEELQKEKSKNMQLETQLAEKGAQPEYSRPEEHIAKAMQGFGQVELEKTIEAYKTIFPEGISSKLQAALLTTGEYILREIGDTLRNIEGITANGEQDVEGILNTLEEFDKDFKTSEYAQKNRELYENAKGLEENWIFRPDNQLSREEREAKEIIDNYEDVEKDHRKKQHAARKLISKVNELASEHQKCVENTAEFREKNLPFKAELLSYAYSFAENQGDETKYVLRFVLPAINKSISEDIAADFAGQIASSFEGRQGETRGAEILGLKCIDLVYNEDISGKVEELVGCAMKAVEKSYLGRIGAKINVRYVGGVPEHDR